MYYRWQQQRCGHVVRRALSFVLAVALLLCVGVLSGCAAFKDEHATASVKAPTAPSFTMPSSLVEAIHTTVLGLGLSITQDYRDEFIHGDKGAEYQKYIVLHDTESEASAAGVVSSWDASDAGIAAHFIINKDGSIVQCVPLDAIAHHAGFGDTGHNSLYGVEDESRDDKKGTTPIGSWASDYGMNSYSVGIEMVHVGGSGEYPQAQLEALDALIAYIDAYYGFESTIIDHKAWRSGNSDTSPEFAQYLTNYQNHRSYQA